MAYIITEKKYFICLKHTKLFSWEKSCPVNEQGFLKKNVIPQIIEFE